MNAVSCRIGCPAWAHAPWVGRFFTATARREEYLRQYASVFGATEANATFHAIPSVETVRKWTVETPAGFQFCWKFPKVITHERQLVDAQAETRLFFERLAPLADRTGPLFLQLHASFGADRLPVLEEFLRGLPAEFRYAVEWRHPELFDGGARERHADERLAALGVERVVFDTTTLFATARPTDPFTTEALRKKPRVPRRETALGRTPFVRFVGDPVIERNTTALTRWAEVVARWIGEGRTPYVFVHHPDETHAPELARLFQALLHARCATVPPPPEWPAEIAARTPPAADEQLALW